VLGKVVLNKAMKARDGYKCKIKDCPKSKNRLFTQEGLKLHLKDVHGLLFTNKDYKRIMTYGEYVKESEESKIERANKYIENIRRYERTKVSR